MTLASAQPTLALLALAACAGPAELVRVPEGTAPGPVETVLVSSIRAPDPGPAIYSDRPARALSFARFDIALPPGPGRDVLVSSAHRLANERAFIAALNASMAGSGARESTIFVHGFRNGFADALAQHAKFQAELDRPGAVVHFAWPATPSSLAYLRDFDRALQARDGLEETMEFLARSEAEEITLVASSLGAFLAMDTLRTMARGQAPVFAKLAAIILIGADIELDVFRAQAEPVAARGVTIYVVTAEGDRALRLAALLRGEDSRLGSASPEALAGLPVVAVDATALTDGEPYGHIPIGRAPDLIRFVRSLAAP